VIAALLVLAAAAQPFSHRLHLKMKLDCAVRHAGAAASTKVSDNLLPDRQVCLKCHQDAAIPPPPPAIVSRFNHSLHLKMGNLAPVIAKAIDSGAYLSPPGDARRHLNAKNACAACHRGMEESDAVTRANLPRMADCLVCHNKIEPPFSCEKCHDDVARLIPASHVPEWVDIHSSGKANLDKQSCAVCHGRRFTCQGCH
jgi:hypothetical protein